MLNDFNTISQPIIELRKKIMKEDEKLGDIDVSNEPEVKEARASLVEAKEGRNDMIGEWDNMPNGPGFDPYAK
jgi:hypothetical protein